MVVEMRWSVVMVFDIDVHFRGRGCTNSSKVLYFYFTSLLVFYSCHIFSCLFVGRSPEAAMKRLTRARVCPFR
jgi:hypothetical protein